jgi:hypothetical protein
MMSVDMQVINLKMSGHTAASCVLLYQNRWNNHMQQVLLLLLQLLPRVAGQFLSLRWRLRCPLMTPIAANKFMQSSATDSL